MVDRRRMSGDRPVQASLRFQIRNGSLVREEPENSGDDLGPREPEELFEPIICEDAPDSDPAG
jgi:hypothetical protein